MLLQIQGPKALNQLNVTCGFRVTPEEQAWGQEWLFLLKKGKQTEEVTLPRENLLVTDRILISEQLGFPLSLSQIFFFIGGR